MRTAITICACGYRLDAAVSADGLDIRPKENDVDLCLKCARIWLFNADLSRREPTLEELQILKSNKDTWKAINWGRSVILSKVF